MAAAAVPAVASGVGAAASLYQAYKASRPKPGPLGGAAGPGYQPSGQDRIGAALNAVSSLRSPVQPGDQQPTGNAPPPPVQGPTPVSGPQPMQPVPAPNGTVPPQQPNPQVIGAQAAARGQIPPLTIGAAFRGYYA